MIKIETITEELAEILTGTGIFLVDVKVDKSNRITVHVDRQEGITIDDCVVVSRALEGRLNRDEEDFALEVSSPGLDAAFRVPDQYRKNIGKMLDVKCRDGNSYTGILKDAGDDRILLELPAAGKDKAAVQEELRLEDIVTARLHLQF